MSIKRGTNTIQRKNAKNFTHGIAQRRLEEALVPFKQQILNSLEVDAVEIDYYSIQRRVGVTCSCTGSDSGGVIVKSDRLSAEVTMPNSDGEELTSSIQFQDDNIFGSDLSQRIFQEDFDDVESVDVSGDLHVPVEDSFTGGSSSVNCGICYRTGNIPAFKAINKQRFVLTHSDIEDMEAFYVDRTTAPFTISKHSQSAAGWVQFTVPTLKFYKHVYVSVRNNLDHMAHEHLYSVYGERLVDADFREAGGQPLSFRVRSQEFTHVVIEYELDAMPIKANISAESQALDYNRLMTIGDIQVTLPPTLANVENGDILIVRNRNLSLLIRDKEWKATADRKTFGWRASTRVLQPSESFRNLHLGQRLR